MFAKWFTVQCMICTAMIYTVISRKKDMLKSSVELLQKEEARLKSEAVGCSFKTLSVDYLDIIRIDPEVSSRVKISCHIEYLLKNNEAGWIWSSLGTIYMASGTFKHTSMGSNCFKQAAKLDGISSKYVKQWHFLGPFVIGKGEVDGDPLDIYGGILNITHSRTSKKQSVKFLSELGANGVVNWETYNQGKEGDQIQVIPKVNWNDFVNSLGSTGITEWQGWILGEFSVNNNNANVVLQCHFVHTVFVDDIIIAGDVYGRQSVKFSVSLSRGIHTIRARLRGKGPQHFRCQLSSASSPFEISKPQYMPDLFEGYLFSNYLYIPISNHHHKWLKNIRVSVEEHSADVDISASVAEKHVGIAPGQTRQMVILLSASEERVVQRCSSVDLKLKVKTSEGALIYPLSLRCRKQDESFIYTFLDHDGSVQHAAAVHPIDKCLSGVCPTVLSLHGTTVPAQNQADSYKRMINGKYVFGVDSAWLLAPTRHGAHNWEGPGALTALRALEALSALSSRQSWIDNVASSDDIIFAGHSMGGHGAWHLATHYPDKALALVTLAGWIKKEEYGDSNLFFRHDISTSYVDPSVKYIMESCIYENDVDQHASNLHGIPIMARIGANDRTVHPFLVRRMYRIAKEWKLQIKYIEIPGKEHWWWDTKDTNDGGCVNDQQLRDFMNKYASINLTSCDGSACDSMKDLSKYSRESNEPQKFTLTVKNPALGGSIRGILILQQKIPFRSSTIKVAVEPSSATFKTWNVIRFSIEKSHIRQIDWFKKTLMVDNSLVNLQNSPSFSSPVHLCLHEGLWSVCSDALQLNTPTMRGPSNLGPARRAAENPFLIVTGTQGTDELNKALLEYCVYIANMFYMTSDTAAPILKDTDLTEELAAKYNLILIGGPAENSKTSNFIATTPLNIEESTIRLGQCVFQEDRLGALVLAPHGDGKLALVLLGTSVEGLMDVVTLASPTIPPMTRSPFSNMVPDFIITGPSYRSRGPGGYMCAGFWGNFWELRSELISCAHCA